MQNKIHTVILCWHAGGDFHFSDVDLLAFHIRKQYDGDGELRIYCITNTVKKPFRLVNVTLLPVENSDWYGWWIKMNMFAPSMEQYRPFLYMDLDTAVVNSLNGILPPEGHEHKFITLSSFFSPPRKNELQTGMMWFPAKNEAISKIWDVWIKNPEGIIKKYHHNGGDQSFLRSVITMSEEHWQGINNNKVWSYKINPTKEHLIQYPKHLSVICFHGIPRIPVAGKTVVWVHKYIEEATS